MLKKKICTALLAGMMGLGAVSAWPGAEAASREQIAAIQVTKASDFRYWNANAPTLKKITQFVEEATNPASPHFIPVADRVAVFDMDGTFYCETAPLYFQETMFLYRALEDKDYQPDKQMREFAAQIRPKIMNKTGLSSEENKTLGAYLTKAYQGMTPEEYRAYVHRFMQTNEDGLSNLKRGEAFYLPMVEVISYLVNNNFAVYIDSACGIDTTRALAEGVVPIPSDRIIASDFVYTTTNMGQDKADSHFYDRNQEKVVISGERVIENGQTEKIFSILKYIGKKPVLAFGNSMGDSGMFEYALQDNPYNSAAFCVLCDDTERELGNAAKAEKMRQKAEERGWNTISMRDEFKTIYGDKVKRTDKAGSRK